MALLILSIVIVLSISALCSLSEAALYAVRMPYVRELADRGHTAGNLLRRFKENMDRPITAVLILNTVANTAGAAVAGAQARVVFGESALVWFSATFTLAVLFFSEVLPKVVGVAYNEVVSRMVAVPLNWVVTALHPLVWLSQHITRLVQGGRPVRIAPEEEVRQLAMLSAEEGSILPFEAELVRNVLRLDEIKARDIMTPRTVVFKVASNRTVKDVSVEAIRMPHARIPIYAADDPENWVGVALSKDIFAAFVEGNVDFDMASLGKPLGFVPELMPGHKLLAEFIRRREHLLGVIDEYGAVVGVVTLEDVLESLLGEEIVDETDFVVDLQKAARERGAQQFDSSGSHPEGDRPGQGRSA